jgi:hypothetical protein
MKKFIITETRVVHQLWVYEVEAENGEDALERVMNGDVEGNDETIDGGYEAEYDVEEITDEGPEYDSAGYTEVDRIVNGQYMVRPNKQ